jgi:Reverse transcriptase (RNA-dependent DNA polymerase)
MGYTLFPMPSNSAFRFGDGCQVSLGFIVIRFPFAFGQFLDRNVDVVQADISFLMGLDLMDEVGVLFDNTTNQLMNPTGSWSIPVVRKFGHAYIEWPAEVMYMETEVRRLHSSFYHPSADKLFNLIRRANPSKATTSLHDTINGVCRSCTACQEFYVKPTRFKVFIPEMGIVFNRQVALDLMFVKTDGHRARPLLHVVDVETNFSAATFLRSESAQNIWDAFMKCWASVYIGFPDLFRTDAGSVFILDHFQRLASSHGVEIQYIGVESHNSIAAGESLHSTLRRVYNRIISEHPSIGPELALQFSVKASNDTANADGLVPSLLVFGVLPRFPIAPADLPDQGMRMAAIQAARAEMEQIVCAKRIQRALASRSPTCISSQIRAGMLVLVFREKFKTFVGPFDVFKVDDKQAWIAGEDGVMVQYHISQLKPYVEPADTSADDSVFLASFSDMLHTYIDNEPLAETTFKKMIRQHSQLRNFRRKSALGMKTVSIFATQTLELDDPTAHSSIFDEAKQKEIEGLERRGTWKVVDQSSLSLHATILGGRFVCTSKEPSEACSKPVFKARFVCQGHRDKERFFSVHNATTIRQPSMRLIACVAGMFGFRIWSDDVSPAFLQSQEQMGRRVFVRPPKEFGLSDGSLLELLKPLYGLPDAGDLWHSTFSKFIKDGIGKKALASDPSLYYKASINGELQGVIGTYVDDSLSAGTNVFEKETRETLEAFESRKREFDHLVFAGVSIDRGDAIVMA